MSPCQGEGRRFKSAPPLTYIYEFANLTYTSVMCHSDEMQGGVSKISEDFGFWKNVVLVSVFFIVTPLTIGISLFSLFSIEKSNTLEEKFHTTSLVVSPKSGVSVYASLPSDIPSVSFSINPADARPQIVKQYLEEYNSPLVSYASYVVDIADKYSIDYRLITAIAQQESNLCKIIPPGSYNCWGWGIHSKGTLGFNSFEEGIETVSRGLRQEYLDKGYSTVEEIMSKYTPLSNGSWAMGVSSFMSEMQ